jgi:hypothetical protein
MVLSTLRLRDIHDKMRRKKRKEEFIYAEASNTIVLLKGNEQDCLCSHGNRSFSIDSCGPIE